MGLRVNIFACYNNIRATVLHYLLRSHSLSLKHLTSVYELLVKCVRGEKVIAKRDLFFVKWFSPMLFICDKLELTKDRRAGHVSRWGEGERLRTELNYRFKLVKTAVLKLSM